MSEQALKKISLFSASAAISIALLDLLAYTPGLEIFGSISEDFIPMAPSTAISFLILGGILVLLFRQTITNRVHISSIAFTSLVTFFGMLEVVGHFTGMDLNFENQLVPELGYLLEIPIGRMSPSTGALFLLAGLALLALLLKKYGSSPKCVPDRVNCG